MDFGGFMIIITLIEMTACTCTYPSFLRGDWYSSRNGLLTVSDSSIANLELSATQTGAHTYTCEVAGQGERYISKTTVSFFSTSTMDIWLCLHLTYVNSATYLLSFDTEPSNTYGARLVLATSTSNFVGSYSSVCTDTNSKIKGTHDILVKKNDSSAKQTCPDILQGDFTLFSGRERCAGSKMYGTPKSSTLTFTNSSCISPLSASGIYDCVHSLTSGQFTYVNVLNNDTATDEINTFRLSCMVIEKRVHILYLTENPQVCFSNQTSTSVGTAGKTMVLVKSDPSVSNSGQIAAAVVMSFICLCVQVFALGSCLNWCIKHKALTKVDPAGVKYV